MPDLEPITREEMLLDGEDLTPITRKEMFIKRIYDKTQEVPEPVTREEMFLKKAGEGGGGDIDLQTLNVTENGTVNAPSGVAYNKVVTNVPSVLPENAYLLEEYENVPTDIASFTASDAPLKSLTASIIPVQDLHGYDAPWVGGAGKNKFDADNIQNGYINDSGELVARTYQACSPYIPITASQTYTASAKTQFNNFGFAFFDSSKNIILPRYDNNNVQSATKTAPSNAVYMRIWVDYNSSTTLNSGKVKELQVQVEQGSTATSYEPYSNICPISGWTNETMTVTDDLQNPTVTHTTTIPFTDGQGQSVEVFGGSDEVVSGALSVNQFCYTVTDDTIITKSGNYFEINNVLPEDATANYQFIASFCKRTETSLAYMIDGEGRFVTDRRYLAVKLPYSTVEDAKTYLTSINAQIVYTLPTSTTLQQQPTSIKSLDGENNVSASTGQIENLEFFTKEA